MATTETVLSPALLHDRFRRAWTASSRQPIRAEWDALMEEFRADPNKGHFVRTEAFDEFRLEALPEPLQKELVEFLVSSVTRNSRLRALCRDPQAGEESRHEGSFAVMSRDEARHAGFINDALKDIGIGVTSAS
jgi:magnesium-protoporphyrin IX monomethyl ester (oxidative) cyclase